MKRFVPFTLKSASDGYTYIEGVANKAIVDRGNDLIDPKAWDLKNYGKNPVILYNHDRDKIIGRAVDIKPQEDGLYIKCRISKSRDSMVSYVRDMIEEGMINAFSVGFASKDAAKSKDGVNTITSAELYEVSVVSIPMNQDSIFTVSMKDISDAGNLKNVRRKFLEAKAAPEKVLQIQDMLDAMEALGADREECILGLCEATGIDRDVMRELLCGDSGEASGDLVKAAQDMLDELRTNKDNDQAPEAKAKPTKKPDPTDDADGADGEDAADEEGDLKPKKPKKAKAPKPPVDGDDAEKSVGVPGNGSEMTVQTDVQAIMTQNNVLLATVIVELQKLNAQMTQYLAAEEIEDAAEKPEESADVETASPEALPTTEPDLTDGGKTLDAEGEASKMIEGKLAQIKAMLAAVKKTV